MGNVLVSEMHIYITTYIPLRLGLFCGGGGGVGVRWVSSKFLATRGGVQIDI